MTVPTYNTAWGQGEDLIMSFIYKKGPVGAEVPVDLTSYSLRMDIVAADGTRLYTFNSAPIADVDPGPATTPDNTEEAVLGADGLVTITIPRTVTLPGGAIYSRLTATPPETLFNYDIFLRDSTNHQTKILKGAITVELSYTIWV